MSFQMDGGWRWGGHTNPIFRVVCETHYAWDASTKLHSLKDSNPFVKTLTPWDTSFPDIATQKNDSAKEDYGRNAFKSCYYTF
jgi:hypothetical protein